MEEIRWEDQNFSKVVAPEEEEEEEEEEEVLKCRTIFCTRCISYLLLYIPLTLMEEFWSPSLPFEIFYHLVDDIEDQKTTWSEKNVQHILMALNHAS